MDRTRGARSTRLKTSPIPSIPDSNQLWRRFAANGGEGCSRARRTGLTMGPEHAAAGFGAITPIFGFGQIIGPAIAGAAPNNAPNNTTPG